MLKNKATIAEFALYKNPRLLPATVHTTLRHRKRQPQASYSRTMVEKKKQISKRKKKKLLVDVDVRAMENFALGESYYGVNGNVRCTIKERTAMREAAEVLCGATFAPQINPSWSRAHHSAIENLFKDPAFKACPVAQMCLNYSAELKNKRGGNPKDGLGLSELPIVL